MLDDKKMAIIKIGFIVIDFYYFLVFLILSAFPGIRNDIYQL